MRRELPSVVLFVVGLLLILERFLNVGLLAEVGQEIRTWGIIVAAFAVAVASMNLIVVHVRNVRQRKNIIYSLTLLLALIGMAGLGIATGTDSDEYKFWYNSLLSPMSSAMFAMLAFYIASAAYRAFIAKNAEAAVLLISAVLLMLGNVALGEMIHPNYGAVSSWIMNVPNLAGQRGMMIASAIGAVATSLRVLVGIDRTHFGGGE